MNSAALVIRPIRPEDYATEASIVHAAYAAGPYAADLAGDTEWLRTERDSAGRTRDGQVLVAELDGTIVGAATVLRGDTEYAKLAVPGEAEVRMVAVDPAAQGRGIGSALVRASIEEALRWGSTTLRLDTGVRNPAQHLYESLGFVRTPEKDALLQELSYGDSLTYEYPLQLRNDLRVRLIHPNEYASVSALVLSAYVDDYPDLGPVYRAEIADVAGRAVEHLVWIAEDVVTGELLGTITTPRPGKALSDVVRGDGEMDIRLLGVAHSARGRGIGEALTRHGMLLAKIRGASKLLLNTSEMMEAAWRLYERLGFARELEREHAIIGDDGSEIWLLAYGIDV